MDRLTFASTVMEALVSLVDAIAWPIVAVCIIFLLRPPIAGLIGFIETVKYKGVEVAFRSVERAPGDQTPLPKDVLEQFWLPGGQRSLENDAILRKWMNSKNISMSITAFLNAGNLDAARRRAVEELNLDQPNTGADSNGQR